MTHLLTNLHWLSIGVAFFAYFILGALWFTVLFSRPYRASLGKENEPTQKPAPIFIIGPAICSLIITIATAVLMEALQVHSYSAAFKFAVIIGVGYLVANTVNIAINPNIPRPLYYGLISGAYHLTGIVIVCLILVSI